MTRRILAYVKPLLETHGCGQLYLASTYPPFRKSDRISDEWACLTTCGIHIRVRDADHSPTQECRYKHRMSLKSTFSTTNSKPLRTVHPKLEYTLNKPRTPAQPEPHFAMEMSASCGVECVQRSQAPAVRRALAKHGRVVVPHANPGIFACLPGAAVSAKVMQVALAEAKVYTCTLSRFGGKAPLVPQLAWLRIISVPDTDVALDIALGTLHDKVPLAAAIVETGSEGYSSIDPPAARVEHVFSRTVASRYKISACVDCATISVALTVVIRSKTAVHHLFPVLCLPPPLPGGSPCRRTAAPLVLGDERYPIELGWVVAIGRGTWEGYVLAVEASAT